VLLLECAGTPGSGKSTIVAALQAWLDASAIPFVDLADFMRVEGARRRAAVPKLNGKLDFGNKDADILLKSFRYFFLEEPEYTLRYLHALLELESRRDVRDLVLSSFNYACAQRGFFEARRERVGAAVAIHEEGFVHRLFTLFGYRIGDARDEAVLEELAERTPRPDMLIWTRCSADVALDRLEKRERKIPERLVGLSPQEAADLLGRADRKLEIVARILEKRGTRVAEVRTDKHFDEGALFDSLFKDRSLCGA
jgi:hypothetical protein